MSHGKKVEFMDGCRQIRCGTPYPLVTSGQRTVGLRERAALRAPWRMSICHRMWRRTPRWTQPWYVPDVSHAPGDSRVSNLSDTHIK